MSTINVIEKTYQRLVPVAGWVKTSLIDYPDHIASTVFLAGCNFRCPYCHNPDLIVENHETVAIIPTESIIAYIRRYKGLLEGICISGGEPLIHQGLLGFLRDIKALGLKIKLDTNGSLPHVLQRLVDESLIDYVAMDIKGAPDKVHQISRSHVPAEKLRKAINTSINIIKESGFQYEFRTTVVPGIIDIHDMEAIGRWLEGARLFVIQQFRPDRTLDPGFSLIKPYPPKFIEDLASRMKSFFEKCTIRGLG